MTFLEDNKYNLKLIITPLYEAKGWMKLIGIVSIIGGALYALTLVGIIIAWLPIWMGILLNKSAGLIEQAYNSDDELILNNALKKLKTYFIINGVLVLISIAGVGLALLFGGISAILNGLNF